MRASSPLLPTDVSPASSSSFADSQPSNSVHLDAFPTALNGALDRPLQRSASTEWREWEETLDSFSAAGALDAALEVDLNGLDQFLMATADDFLEPFADVHAPPIFAADATFLHHHHQQAPSGLHAAGVDAQLETLMAFKTPPQLLQSSTQRHRKRKIVETHRPRAEADKVAKDSPHAGKKAKTMQTQQSKQTKPEVEVCSEQADKLFRRRFGILHGILEAWNTGGIEDLEEIADSVYEDDVTLISPDYANGLYGVKAVMSHWNTLLDAFPDGIMEEYVIQRDQGSSDKMTASWVFSGTQIYPIHGVQPRHKKVCINGKSFFWFNGEKIRHVVVSWNYRETLMKLMGVQPDQAGGVLSSPAFPGASTPLTSTVQAGGARP